MVRVARSVAVLRRLGRWSLITVVSLLGLVVVSVAALQLALRLPSVQNELSVRISRLLGGVLEGRIEVKVGPTSLLGTTQLDASAHSKDAEESVLVLRGVTARVATGELLWSLVAEPRLVVRVEHLTIDEAELSLRGTEESGLLLAEALSPQPSQIGAEQSEDHSRGPLVLFESVVIEQLRVWRARSAPRPLATLANVRGEFSFDDSIEVRAHSDGLKLFVPERDLVLVGKLTAELAVAGDSTRIETDVEGMVGGVELRASGQLEGEQWSAWVTANGAAQAWRELEMGVSPDAPIALELDAEGDFSRAFVTVDGSSGITEAHVTAGVEFSPLRVEGGLAAEHVDPRVVSPDLPQADVSLKGSYEVQVEPSLQVRATVRSEAGEVAGERLPPLIIDAKSSDGRRLDFDLRSAEEGGAKLSIQGQVEQADEAVKFAIKASADDLPQTSWRRRLEPLRVDDIELEVDGEYEPSTQRLRGNIDARVERLRLSSAGIDARRIVIDAQLEGNLQRPVVSARVRADHLRLPGVRLSSLRLGVRPADGNSVVSLATRARLDGASGPTLGLRLQTTVTSVWPLQLRNGRLGVNKGETVVSAAFDAVRVGERTTLEEFSLRGVGSLSLDATIVGEDVQAKVRSEELRLGSLSALLAPITPRLSGVVTVDGEVTLVGGRLRSGRLHGKATALKSGPFNVDHVAASLVVEEQRVSGSALAFRGGSWMRLDARDTTVPALAGHASDATEPWLAGLEGTVNLTASVSSDDLAQMTAKLTPELQWTGQVGVEGRFQKTSAAGLSGFWVVRGRHLGVRHLASHEGQGAKRAQRKGPVTQGWLMRDLTFDWAAGYDSATAVFSNALRVSDPERQRQVLGASVAATIASEDLLAGNLEAIQRAPLQGALEIPKMSLTSIPLGLIPSGVEAAVAANVRVAGSILDPELSGFVELEDFSVQSLHGSLPVNLRVEGRFADSGVTAEARVLREGKLVAQASVDGSIAGGKTNYVAEAELHSIPLGCFPYVRDYGVTGVLGGSISLRDEDGRQVLEGLVEGRRLSASDVDIPRLDVSVDFKDGTLVSRVDVRENRGSLQAEFSARSSDGTLAALEATQLQLAARNFEIEPLLALVREPVEDVSGIVDADIRVQLDVDPPRASGELVLENGSVHVQALGQHFREVELRLVASPGRVQLSKLSAMSASGRIEGDGQARYDRDGLLSGRAKLRIDRKHAIPIVRQGRTIAHASGRVDLVASRSSTRSLEVGVEVPHLDVRLTDESPQTLQNLEPPENITLGAVGPDGRFVALDVEHAVESAPADQPIEIDVHLGDDVWVHRGPGVFASLEGDVTVLLGDDVRLHGELRSQQGQIEVAGRIFRVRRGTIALTGNSPPNPDVVAEAEWEAPSGYTVIAAFRGPLSTGELTLRSEPPLSQGQILNVLLFDSPEGAVSEEGSGGSAASSVAASVAGAGMSRALSDLTNLEVSAAVDTSEEGAPRPELGVRLNPRLSVAVSYAPNPTPSLGRPPDRGIVSLDWRLSRRWTLESAFGDSGSASTDLVWRLRY